MYTTLISTECTTCKQFDKTQMEFKIGLFMSSDSSKVKDFHEFQNKR